MQVFLLPNLLNIGFRNDRCLLVLMGEKQLQNIRDFFSPPTQSLLSLSLSLFLSYFGRLSAQLSLILSCTWVLRTVTWPRYIIFSISSF